MKARISKAHVQIYRAIEGAVRNTADGHPNWPLTDRMARSIAKRATGTLTASWPDVLAARSMPSEANDPVLGGNWPPRRAQSGRQAGERRYDLGRRSPLRKLWKEISIKVGEAKRSGQIERAEALIEVLRRVDSLCRS